MSTATIERAQADDLGLLRANLRDMRRAGLTFDPNLAKLVRASQALDAEMTDNTTMNAGSGGDVVRSVQKTTPKSSVVVLDLGGGGTEDVTAFPGAGANRMMKAEDAASADGDWGIANLGIRKDTPTSLVSADADYSALLVSQLGALWVVQAPQFTVQVTSGGLTTATTAYSVGDQVGTQFTVANAALRSGGGGDIIAAWVNDETAIVGNLRLWVYNATVTPAADNAAFSMADADSEKMACPPLELGPALSASLNNNPWWSGSMSYVCAATSLFINVQTLVGHTFFGATTSLKLNVVLARSPA